MSGERIRAEFDAVTEKLNEVFEPGGTRYLLVLHGAGDGERRELLVGGNISKRKTTQILRLLAESMDGNVGERDETINATRLTRTEERQSLLDELGATGARIITAEAGEHLIGVMMPGPDEVSNEETAEVWTGMEHALEQALEFARAGRANSVQRAAARARARKNDPESAPS